MRRFYNFLQPKYICYGKFCENKCVAKHYKAIIIKIARRHFEKQSAARGGHVKKYLLILVLALLIIPGTVLAQNESLSTEDINRIANSVVLIVTLDRNGDSLSSGSGTIVASTGEIYTNRHVVEGGADYAILTLSSIGEPAQLAYFATATLVHPAIDFAVLQIDRDANGRALDPNQLNLPVIPLSDAQASIGERIFVFGYPDLGDAHLVFTSGAVTTILNDTVNGQRLPFWYQTDAQISPGNSGGLVVNGDGRMIGIPTLVRAEERTLGRLGAILTVTAIRAALDLGDEQQAVPDTTFVQPTPAPGGKGTPAAPLETPEAGEQLLSIQITNVEHEVTQNDTLGMMIHTTANAAGFLGVPLRAAVFAFWDDDQPMPPNNRAPIDARTDNGQLTLQQVVTPAYDNSIWDDLWFFMPYSYLPEGRTGTFPAYISAQLGVDGQPFTAIGDPVTFTYTYPDRQLITDITRIDHNVTMNGEVGMQVFARLDTLGYQDTTLRTALFVYWEDGTPVPGDNAPSDNRTTSGNLTVQATITPSRNDSVWEEFWFFLPYAYFPTGLQGEQFAYAEVELGIDGEGFSTWSIQEPFSLTYN